MWYKHGFHSGVNCTLYVSQDKSLSRCHYKCTWNIELLTSTMNWCVCVKYSFTHSSTISNRTTWTLTCKYCNITDSVLRNILTTFPLICTRHVNQNIEFSINSLHTPIIFYITPLWLKTRMVKSQRLKW